LRPDRLVATDSMVTFPPFCMPGFGCELELSVVPFLSVSR
jgi:hypothetical protein